jgi:UDP-N-acetylglucosamine:LPS N-acetylglucosamine transferase
MTDPSIPPAPAWLPTLLVILSGGGFTFETRTLLGHLREQANFTYIRTGYGGIPGQDGIPPGEARDVPSFATVTRKSLRISLYAFAKTFLVALSIILSRRIDAILGLGCSHAIPMLLAGRLTGCRNIFIETITRTDQLSNTGKIVYHLRLSDQFFVQWPDLQAKYPRSSGGTIL